MAIQKPHVHSHAVRTLDRHASLAMTQYDQEKNMPENITERARLLPKGNHYGVFEVGQVFEHHWGRTINAGDNSLFTTLTLSYNPLLFQCGICKGARASGHCRQSAAGVQHGVRADGGRFKRRRRAVSGRGCSLPIIAMSMKAIR